jgi:hypothetical protein
MVVSNLIKSIKVSQKYCHFLKRGNPYNYGRMKLNLLETIKLLILNKIGH